MNSIDCNVRKTRAQKARFAAHMDAAGLRYLLVLLAVASIVAWSYFVFVAGQSIGHLLLIGVGLSLVPVLWYLGELRQLKPEQTIEQVTDISEVLDRKILAKLQAKTTPKDLALIAGNLPGGFFYANRFGLSGRFVAELTDAAPQALGPIWQQALQLARTNQLSSIDATVVMAALVQLIPARDAVLAQLQISNEEVLEGLQWSEHINKVIAHHQQKRSYGGIGRDLSFGWAPLLNNVGLNLTEDIQRGGLLRREVAEHEAVIGQVLHLLAQPGRRNAVLVGEVGVGKTTLAHAIAQQLLENTPEVPAELRYQQVIALDAASLIANAKGRGQLEELLIRIVNEAIAAKNIILFLDEAQLFLKDGTGSVDLSSILLPVIEGGALRIIVSLSDQEWLKLSQTNPGLAQLMNRVVMKPLDQVGTMQVIEDQVLLLEAQHRVVYMYQSLHEAYKLAERFIREQAFPGKAIKLLEAAAGFPEQQHFITARSVQQAVEKTFDVRVQTASSTEERDTLLNLEQRIHERMINQSRAVKLVSDALRRARAGVRNEKRPIGTFLFLGPTGVGKTELSKSLAATYFGGEDRLVRIDLNEYSRPDDTNRLITVGAEDPYSLCAQIAKQPFSVVLLDEIEKAHPNVLNMLLQMMDEGMLRDTQNKPVSFRDAIIITTSNAGADKIREHIQRGEQLEQFEENFVNELINANIFRPEFLNRFDEIILFRPLTQEELVQVVDLNLQSLNKRLAAQKLTVALTPAAKALLAKAGYDPRLGARPLARVMQRAVENIVAQRVLQGTATPGQTIQLDAPELQQNIDQR